MAGNVPQVLQERWQQNLMECAAHIRTLVHESCLSNHTIHFSDNSSIKVHSLFLALNSPVFHAIFFGSLVDNEIVCLPEDSPEAFMWLLTYVYTGRISFSSVEVALEVLIMADKYLVYPLAIACIQFVGTRLTDENVYDVYNVAALLDVKELLSRCCMYLRRSKESMWTDTKFGRLSLAALRHLVKRPERYIDAVVFRGLLVWGRSQTENGDVVSCKELRCLIKEFLPYVNYNAMEIYQLQLFVLPSDILTYDEKTDILALIKEKIDPDEYHETLTAENKQIHRFHIYIVPSEDPETNPVSRWCGEFPNENKRIHPGIVPLDAPKLRVSRSLTLINEHHEHVRVTRFRSFNCLQLKKVIYSDLPECSIVVDLLNEKGEEILTVIWCKSSMRLTKPIILYHGRVCVVTVTIFGEAPAILDSENDIEEGKSFTYNDGPVSYYWYAV
ncbi:BTB/POZ domain-containing protein 6-B-like isoform X1 [Cherax quadricarinatus]|uniref:BTB/POZ domain-containing protein 6-B-like isoform X1 n=2 Tax=Cherax quadricarinatus TaxID=27406 RepID=UPI00387E7280